ncbi:MAG: hypothetical protein Q9220_006087 [cf. Caloplaca sp. 1 TL-2023]
MARLPRVHVPCSIRSLLRSRSNPFRSFKVPRQARFSTTARKPRLHAGLKARAQSDTNSIQSAGSIPSAQLNENHLTQIKQLQEEKSRVEASVQLLNEQLCQLLPSRQNDATMKDLISRQKILREEICGHQKDLEGYSDIDPGHLEKKSEDIVVLRTRAERWTDNIEILEGWFRRGLFADDFYMDLLRRHCYGTERV